MHVRPTDPATATGLIDPDTKRRPFVDPDTGKILESAHVPESSFWVRRLRAREIAIIAPRAPAPTPAASVTDEASEVEVPEPTGREPLTPITTR